MEVMELREELDEASSEEELKVIKEKNEEKFQKTVKKLQSAFDQKDYVNAKDLAIELQYWSSIQNAIQEWHP
ncbi:Co-chaperone HscB, C-terminal oligomerization domain-containing protein [Sporodiniella umbellata]|nr:Co-chaperone HscB, C-terminal oligomerization domain-containing protein [Sporodiniella umbellata]